MRKSQIILSLLILLIGVLVFWFKFASGEQDSLHDGKYTINGEKISLRNGISEKEITNSSAKIITRYFGDDARADFNNDGREDVAFLVTQNTGGSGTFYYLVVRLNNSFGSKGSFGLFLGDRIAPQNIVIQDGNSIVVNYADRNEGDSFATPPSLGKSKTVVFDSKNMQFGEVIQDFN